MRLLLVRHGQSEWNASHRLQGQADISLSEVGKKQVEDLRPIITNIGPCRAVASDLKRVRETSNLLQATNITFTKELREVDVGLWTGKSIEDIKSEDEAGYLGWRAGTTTPPNGESWDIFSGRVSNAIKAEMSNPCENLLVVCHGGVIRAILDHFLGLEPSRIIPVGPASLTAIRLLNNKPERLELFNYRPHQLDFEAPD